MHFKIFLQLLAVTFLFPVTAAYAYIDAASISMVLQVVVGSVAAAMIAIKVYFHRFMSFFRPKGSEESDDQ